MIVEPGVQTGVPVLIDNPKEVGADRIVNTLAAVTCTAGRASSSTSAPRPPSTRSRQGASSSAARSPRASRSRSTRSARAGAQLRKVELVRPRSVIGKNTVEALQSGILYGFAGQVDGMVDRMADELADDPNDVTVVATGGLAPLVVEEAEVDRRCTSPGSP